MKTRYVSKLMQSKDELDELQDAVFAPRPGFTKDLSRLELINAFWDKGFKSMTLFDLDGLFAQRGRRSSTPWRTASKRLTRSSSNSKTTKTWPRRSAKAPLMLKLVPGMVPEASLFHTQAP